MIQLRLFSILSYLALTFLLTATVALFVTYPHPLLVRLKYWTYGGVLRLLGGRIKRKGAPWLQGQVLFVSNHVSYADILIFGAFLTASFVSKAEVAKWLFIGPFAKLHSTVFVDRKRTSVKGQLEKIQSHFAQGGSLIIFPEGTSADGTHLRPLKSSFLELPADVEVMVQPVSISYTHVHGLPLGRMRRWTYGWFGNMALLPHLKYLLKNGPFTATVIFHGAFSAKNLDRKQLTRRCESTLRRGMEMVMQGPPMGPKN